MKVPQARSSQVWLIRNRDVLPPSVSTSPSNGEHWAVLDSENPMRLSVSPGEQERQKYADVGALRDGEPLELYSWEAVGLLSQYAGVGIMMGFFDVLAWPIFQNYLHMEGYQIASYSALINIGWSSKIFFSGLADCFPIRGYHRRPYMVLDWIICAVSCLIVATTKFPAPYYSSQELFDMPRDQYTPADIARLNLDAPNTGGFFILMCLAACLGYVMATVAADGMVAQYAQREPASIRGRTQTAMYITRDAYSILPMLLVGFCMSDYKYGGDFTWSVEPNGIFWFVVIPCVLAALAAIFLLVETPDAVTISLRRYMNSLWELLEHRIIWQLCLFKLCFFTFITANSTLIAPMAFLDVWVEPFNHSMFMLVTQFLRLVTMFGVGSFALNWDWRKTIAISTVLMALQDFTVNFVATWGYMRWQNAYLGLSSLSAIPQTIIFLFNSYIIVEVADVGNESMVFALMSSFSNLGWPLGTVLAKTFDSFLDANLDSIEDDSTETRWQITYSLIASSAMKIAALAFLAMLPRQKSFVHVLKRIGNSSQTVLVILVCCFALGYVVSFVSNVLSILSGTQCLVIAGGRGC